MAAPCTRSRSHNSRRRPGRVRRRASRPLGAPLARPPHRRHSWRRCVWARKHCPTRRSFCCVPRARPSEGCLFLCASPTAHPVAPTCRRRRVERGHVCGPRIPSGTARRSLLMRTAGYPRPFHGFARRLAIRSLSAAAPLSPHLENAPTRHSHCQPLRMHSLNIERLADSRCGVPGASVMVCVCAGAPVELMSKEKSSNWHE